MKPACHHDIVGPSAGRRGHACRRMPWEAKLSPGDREMGIDQRASETNPDVGILSLSGRLGAQSEQELSASLSRALGKNAAGIILDMSAVEFVSSAGLRALLVAYKQAHADGKKIAMIGVRPAVYKIFKLTSFDSSFEIHQTEAEAVKKVFS